MEEDFVSNPNIKVGGFKMISEYAVHLNFVIASSAGLLIAGIAAIFRLENYICYGLFGFFSTLCVYNSQRWFKAAKETKSPWLKWVRMHKKVVVFTSIFSGFITGYLFFRLLNTVTPAMITLVITATVISFFYVVRIRGKNIREFPHLKIHSIAFTWTLVLIVFPIINENVFTLKTLLIFVPAHYIYFVAVAIPFDIRDLPYDIPTQRTIPQVIGVKRARIVSILLLILAAIGIGAGYPSLVSKPAFIWAILVQTFLAAFTTPKRKEIYYSVLIDGAIALLGISYLVLSNDLIHVD